MAHPTRNAKASYFGRQNPYVRRGFCESCGETRNLYSYDTRDFFALGRIPLAPGRALRILDDCQRCRRHGWIRQADWRRERETSIHAVERALEIDPGNPELASDLAQGFARCQDEAGFDAALPRLRRVVKSSSAGLDGLATALAAFDRRAEATELLREALSLEDTPQRREALAVSLALGLEPREACEHLVHLLGELSCLAPSSPADTEGDDPQTEPGEAATDEASGEPAEPEVAALAAGDPGREEGDDEDPEPDAESATEAPDEEAPDEEAPDEEAPDEEAPDEEAPDEEAPDEEAPDEEAPDEEEDPNEALFSDREASLIFLVVQSAQAAGDHVLALELLANLEAAIPGIDLRQPRAVSTAAKEGKRVKHSAFGERPPDAGPSRGAGAAYFVGPLLLTLLIGGYFALGQVMASQREVHVVNGLRRPYSVSLNGGDPILVGANRRVVLSVPEGPVSVRALGSGLDLPEFTQVIETDVWTRPFLNPTFVLNPDRCAVLEYQRITYSTGTVPSPPPQVKASQRYYTFEGIDYEFTQPPRTIQLQNASTATRVALNLSEFRDPQERFLHVRAFQGEGGARTWLAHYLAADPDQADLLYAYLDLVEKDVALKFLRARLEDRPLRITWHRAYQDLSGGAGAGQLEPEYRKLLAESPDDNDRKYLLARVLLDDVEIKALEESATQGERPSAYGLMVKGFDDLGQARHEAALAKFERALEVRDALLLRYARDLALVHLRRYPELISRLEREFAARPHSFELAGRLIQYHVGNDDLGAAHRIVASCERAWSERLPAEGKAELHRSLQRVTDYATGALARFAQACEEDAAFEAQVAMRRAEEALDVLQRRSDAAFKERQAAKDPDATDSSANAQEFYGLLTVLILARASGAEEVEEKVVKRLLAQTPPPPSPEAEQVVLALSDQAPEPDHAALLALDARPDQKVLFMTLLGQRFPAERARYYGLAKRLNAPLVFPHHLIREVISGE